MAELSKLVSVCIPNFNYGHYLIQCLESVLNQTYPHYEVIFSDNNSDDDSYDIAIQYRKKFLEKGIYCHVNHNKRNMGSLKNSLITLGKIEGDFVHILASDDTISPTFIERCMDVFIEHPNVGMVMTHRDEMDENGRITSTPPFYNTSCIIDGESQAAVFMMAGIAVPGQRMMRQSVFHKTDPYARQFTIAGDWFYNFLYSMVADVGYIKEPLFQYRVHSINETNESERNLQGIFEHFQLIHSFTDISKAFGMTKPASRYKEAVRKLGDMCLRYALKMLKAGFDEVATQYLKLAPIFKPNIEDDSTYRQLFDCVSSKGDKRKEITNILDQCGIQARSVSYDPPEGAIPIKERNETYQ